jgi:hypothetical protein
MEPIAVDLTRKFEDSPAGSNGRFKIVKQIAAIEAVFTVFLLSFWLYTRDNDAPPWYHPDERSKVEQIAAGNERNYRHPQLLLEVSELWVKVFRTTPTVQAYVEAGRDVSAVFGALTVASLACAGYLAFDFAGLLTCALALGLCPSLLVYSHQMKEDAALACGIGMVVLATAAYWRWGRTKLGPVFLAVLGICAAIGPSAKYAGAMSLLCALPALMAPKVKRWPLVFRTIGFGIFFLAAWLAINHRIFDDSHRFMQVLSQETHHALTGHEGVTMDKPNGLVFFTAAAEIRFHIWIMTAGFLALLVYDVKAGGSQWIQASGWQLIVAWFTFGCCAVLSFNTIPFRNYALPVIVLIYFFAAMGAARALSFLKWSSRWASNLAIGGACMVFIAFQLPSCLSLTRGFGDDGRQHLRQWINDNLPQGTQIAENTFALLQLDPDPRPPLGQTKLDVAVHELFDPYCGPESTVPELNSRGVEYVVCCSADYDKYFLPFTRPIKGDEAEFAARKNLYKDLFRNYPVAWSWEPNPPTGTFNNPIIRVYRIVGTK